MTVFDEQPDDEDRRLLDRAIQARETAYTPYSEFSVGAAVRTADGSVHTGCNVENASYGLSMCAERVAIFKAVSEGHREFSAIAVAGEDGSQATPCGACRQVLREFAPSLTVVAETEDGAGTTTLRELLPDSFGPENL